MKNLTSRKRLVLAVLLIVIIVGSTAAGVAQLVSFTAGSPAKATDVNANFAYLGARIVPTGTVLPWAGAGTPPAGWLVCDGSTFSTATYPDLAAVLGTTYGAGPKLPDCRGRTAVGIDPGGLRITGGQADQVGDTSGVAITTDPPTHTHNGGGSHGHRIKAACNNSTCGSGNDGFTRGSGNLDSASFGTLSSTTHNHGSAGASNVSNLPPFITFQYIIKT